MTHYYGQYTPPWATCSTCNLTAPDVAGTPPRCQDPKRCACVLRGESLGGTSWGPAEAWQPKGEDPPRVPFLLPPGPPPAGSWRDFLPLPPPSTAAWEEEQFHFTQKAGQA